ncbi:glycosyltransferase 87 family protein [Sphingomonas tabacisoli]|uniref:Glycosyltransferase 87 family protein n=1 Tax=Sphingomonas tabacisoli TaxID=2249466 RepID=A0ABW4I327_9SPHN
MAAAVTGAVTNSKAVPLGEGGFSRALVAAVIVGLAAALVFQTFSDNYPFDLAYFTTAGRMWAAGLDPYGPAFADHGAPYIAPNAALWAYPPQWWAPSVALGLLDNTAAVIVWKLLNLGALAAGTILLHDAVRPRMPIEALDLLFAALLLTADATRITLHLGQTSLLVLLGFAFLIHGLRFGGEKRKIAGLCLLLLKPQFGLLFLLLTLTLPGARHAALIAVALSASACLPVLATFGVGGTVESAQHFLANLGAYADLTWNRPGELTGISFAAAMLGLSAPSPLACVAAAAGLALWLCREPSDRTGVRLCVVGLACLYAIAPLHPYDMALIPFFLLLLPRLSVAAAIVLTWRTSSVAFALLGTQAGAAFPGIFTASLIQAGAATIAVALLLAGVIVGRPLASDAPAR